MQNLIQLKNSEENFFSSFVSIQRLFFQPINVIIVILIMTSITACSFKKSSGIKKDLNTGLTTSFVNMEPSSAWLEMNNEVLNHTDIPLGNSFLLINENVSDMQVKDGKISAGCSLKISEDNGNVLLHEKDLFAGNDVFAKEESTRLKCTINTGSPMEPEKKYLIQVTFWDKYGDGKIVNECTVKSIDHP